MNTTYRRLITISLITMVCAAMTGCLTVRAPESISVGSGNRVDGGEKIPRTSSHDDARYELRKAYGEIRRLTRKVSHLEEDKRELKQELREAEDDD